MVLDHGDKGVEVYPLFDDGAPPSAPRELEVAPRVIDLARDSGTLRGEVKRRYLRGADVCLSTLPVRVTSCKGDTLELVLADPVAPLAFAPCTWGTTPPSALVRWHH